MHVLFFGTYDASAHPRVAVLRDGLREALAGASPGSTVTECNAPLGLGTADRVAMLRRPWLLPRLAVRLLSRWTRLARDGRRLARRRQPDVVVVGYLGHFDVLLARRLFRRSVVVLDHLVGASDTAADRGVGGGVRQRLLRGLDAAALGSADLVVVDTEEHRLALPPGHRERAVVVAVGAPHEWLAAGASAAEHLHDPLRVVFFGLFTPLQGAPVIGAALAELTADPVRVTMVGSGQDLAETRRLARGNGAVEWHDWVAPDALPALVADHDVCLGIFGTGPKALRVVPNKVFQGAAAGAAVLTSDTPPQRRVLGDAASYVPPGDPGALAARLRELAADRATVSRARTAARALAVAEFAPGRVVAPLVARLRVDVPRSTARPDPRRTAVPAPALPPLSPNGWLRWDVVRRLLPPDGVDVLEVGCGQGGFAARLAQRYSYVGVEPDGVSAAVAAERLQAAGGRGVVHHGDLSVLDPSARFDLVCAFEVIEHIDDDEAALREWAGRLRPGGWLLLSTPAFQHRFGAADEMVGHFRRYDPPVMDRLLRDAGLEEVELVQFGAPLGYLLESGRNAVGRRRQAQLSAADRAERTDASGRTLQPSKPLQAAAARYGTLPFRRLQRAFPRSGPGLVARARSHP